jgi:pyruvate/2-oxoglutarate dehydrogenase complex dihydrolipoamide acyltransferase (E2) component
VAVALKAGGLVVPVIHDADKKNLIEISRELEDLTERAHESRLTVENLSGGTFTITNPGMMGVILDTPIINPPQTAILGVGAIVKRPSVVGDDIVIRQIMYLSLSYDHRVIEGAPAIRFLQKVRQLIESPDSLFAGVTA